LGFFFFPVGVEFRSEATTIHAQLDAYVPFQWDDCALDGHCGLWRWWMG